MRNRRSSLQHLFHCFRMPTCESVRRIYGQVFSGYSLVMHYCLWKRTNERRAVGPGCHHLVLSLVLEEDLWSTSKHTSVLIVPAKWSMELQRRPNWFGGSSLGTLAAALGFEISRITSSLLWIIHSAIVSLGGKACRNGGVVGLHSAWWDSKVKEILGLCVWRCKSASFCGLSAELWRKVVGASHELAASALRFWILVGFGWRLWRFDCSRACQGIANTRSSNALELRIAELYVSRTVHLFISH